MLFRFLGSVSTFFGGMLGNIESLFTQNSKGFSFFSSNCGFSVTRFFYYLITTFIAITFPVWIWACFKRKNGIGKSSIPEIATKSMGELLNERFLAQKELQFHGESLASMFASEMEDSPSSSLLDDLSTQIEPECDHRTISSTKTFCDVCMEEKESCEMFINAKCLHSFCYECTITQITCKIHEGAMEIPCLALNCNTTLNSNVCRLLIPEDLLVKWDEQVCRSLINESHKVYCPFLDCGAMLVNDSQEVITEVKCILCKRSFCAKCNVPWHTDFTCKEYEDHYKKSRKGDKILKILAKKNKWQKCPKCKMYVEKSAGCVHIVCRCKYEFCYRCGAKWSRCSGTCCPK